MNTVGISAHTALHHPVDQRRCRSPAGGGGREGGGDHPAVLRPHTNLPSSKLKLEIKTN